MRRGEVRRGTVATLTVLLCVAGLTARVAAQDAPPGGEPSAQQRQAAAEAYDRGTAAYLSHDYAQAAQWFETANRMAPALPALLQAVRSHDRAGNGLRAANLALRLHAQYGSDHQASRVADPLIASADRHFVRVEATCSGCTVDLDGTLQDSLSFYVEPGHEHSVVAHFDTGSVTLPVNAAAGERKPLAFTAPPPPPPDEHPTDTNPPDNGGGSHGWPANALRHGDGTQAHTDTHLPPDTHVTTTTAPASGGGLTPIVFAIGAGLTAVSGGLLLWSGIDTLGGVDAYKAMPTLAAYDEGHGKEIRTDVFIGVTAALAVGTLVLAFVTDWGGGHTERAPAPNEPTVTATLAPTPGGAMLGAGGTF